MHVSGSVHAVSLSQFAHMVDIGPRRPNAWRSPGGVACTDAAAALGECDEGEVTVGCPADEAAPLVLRATEDPGIRQLSQGAVRSGCRDAVALCGTVDREDWLGRERTQDAEDDRITAWDRGGECVRPAVRDESSNVCSSSAATSSANRTALLAASSVARANPMIHSSICGGSARKAVRAAM